MLANRPDQKCNLVPSTASTQSQQRLYSSPGRRAPHKPGNNLPMVSEGHMTLLLRRRVGWRRVGDGLGARYALRDSTAEGGQKRRRGSNGGWGGGSSVQCLGRGGVPIGSYLSMLMGGEVRGRVNW